MYEFYTKEKDYYKSLIISIEINNQEVEIYNEEVEFDIDKFALKNNLINNIYSSADLLALITKVIQCDASEIDKIKSKLNRYEFGAINRLIINKSVSALENYIRTDGTDFSLTDDDINFFEPKYEIDPVSVGGYDEYSKIIINLINKQASYVDHYEQSNDIDVLYSELWQRRKTGVLLELINNKTISNIKIGDELSFKFIDVIQTLNNKDRWELNNEDVVVEVYNGENKLIGYLETIIAIYLIDAKKRYNIKDIKIINIVDNNVYVSFKLIDKAGIEFKVKWDQEAFLKELDERIVETNTNILKSKKEEINEIITLIHQSFLREKFKLEDIKILINKVFLIMLAYSEDLRVVKAHEYLKNNYITNGKLDKSNIEDIIMFIWKFLYLETELNENSSLQYVRDNYYDYLFEEVYKK